MEKFKSVKRSIARRGSGFFTLCTRRPGQRHIVNRARNVKIRTCFKGVYMVW